MGNYLEVEGGGYHKGQFHKGVDIPWQKHTKGRDVYAVQNGIVEYSNDPGRGNVITLVPFIRGSKFMKYEYLHLAGRRRKGTKKVKAGQRIGKIGNTGFYSGGAHLHFGVLYKKQGTKGKFYQTDPYKSILRSLGYKMYAFRY